MAEYRMKTGKIGEKVIAAYKKIEDGVVGSYKKIEKVFVDNFLEKVEEEKSEQERWEGENNKTQE